MGTDATNMKKRKEKQRKFFHTNFLLSRMMGRPLLSATICSLFQYRSLMIQFCRVV